MNGVIVIAAHNAVAALLMAIVVWAVTRVVRRPAVAHVLWLLVLLRLIAPPMVGLDYAALPAGSDAPSATSSTPAPADVTFPRDSRIATAWRWWMTHRQRSSASPALSHGRAETAFESTSDESVQVIDLLMSLMPLVSVGVTAALVVIAGVRVFRFRRMVGTLEPASPAVQAIAAGLSRRLGLAQTPDVRIGVTASSPFVYSLAHRPVVVLPESLLAELTERQIAMVLAHELAHVRRRDHWVRWIELTAVLACWWNPLVYWVRRRLHEAEELCCDAWVAWLYPDQHRTYADALLRAAELSGSAGSQAPLLLSPLFRVHPLKARIAMIVQGRTPHRNSRGTVLLLAVLALIVLPSYVRLTAADEDGAAESTAAVDTATGSTQSGTKLSAPVEQAQSPDYPGRLNVTVHVVEEQTRRNGLEERTVAIRKPVEGATILAFLGYVDEDGNAVTVYGATAADGAVSIPVPFGHLQVMPPMLPAGYWVDFSTDNPEQFLAITTSPDAPVYRGAYVVRRGSVWNIRAIDADTGEPVGMLQCDVSPVEHHRLNRSGPTVLDAEGMGKFTPPATSGEFRLSVFGPSDGSQIRHQIQYRHVGDPRLTFDEGFDPTQLEAVKISQDSEDVKLVDRNNRSATLRGATVTLKHPNVVIDVKVTRSTPSVETGRLVGIVVDPAGQPVPGARVNVLILTKDGNRAWTGNRARTDAEGRFAIDQMMLRSTKGIEDARFVAMATVEGFAPTDSQPGELPGKAGDVVDLGAIKLAPGYQARIRVIDVLGGPAVGAIVGMLLDQQPTARNVTDEQGEIVLRDLPAGKVRVYAGNGHDMATAEILVPEENGDGVVTTLRLQPQMSLGVEPRHGGPAPVAQPAPALQIAAWSDGEMRSLEKLRGRVVVLYFWDLKEEACDQELAIIDHLRQRFTEDGVVFLGIHPAGSTLDEVRAFMKEKDWRLPTGLDQAGEGGRSLTVESYGVVPSSFVVIGVNGNIAFNRDAVMDDDGGERLYKQAAQALNINLDEEEPETETESKEEGCDKCMQILEYIERRAIENAIGK